MALESFTKQSWEEFVIAGSLENVIATGEAIDLGSSSVAAVDKNGDDVSTTVLDQGTLIDDGYYLKIRCRAGDESLSPYKITFKIPTDAGNKWEIDVKMKIKET